jgi:hypothetical protein
MDVTPNVAGPGVAVIPCSLPHGIFRG